MILYHGGDFVPQYVGSKWRKTIALLASDSLRRIVPATMRFNQASLRTMLDRFGMVYVKPEFGTFGKGVMRVERSKQTFRYQTGKRIRTFSSVPPLYDAILKDTRGKRYLVQRGVHLLKYNGRRFDLRVMVQLNMKKKWETTGIIGRLAAPRKIVTNYHNGGTPMPVQRLFSPHLSRKGIVSKVRSLESMGVRAGAAMKRKFPGVCEIGVDVGMDRTFTPWILEVNTRPDPYIFLKLPDRSIFRKMRRYERAFGRK
jgi:hypothetical protein